MSRKIERISCFFVAVMHIVGCWLKDDLLWKLDVVMVLTVRKSRLLPIANTEEIVNKRLILDMVTDSYG